MDIKEIQRLAVEVCERHKELDNRQGRKVWSREDYIKGLVGDVADLLQASMVKDGTRQAPPDGEHFEHEVGDVLMGICVVAHEYGIDIEKAFLNTVDGLNKRMEVI